MSSMSSELERLAELHRQGQLNDEEFARAKARTLAECQGVGTLNGLRRSATDRWLGGVCGGLARMLGVESWVLRLAFTLLFMLWGTGLIFYILLWIFVPEE